MTPETAASRYEAPSVFPGETRNWVKCSRGLSLGVSYNTNGVKKLKKLKLESKNSSRIKIAPMRKNSGGDVFILLEDIRIGGYIGPFHIYVVLVLSRDICNSHKIPLFQRKCHSKLFATYFLSDFVCTFSDLLHKICSLPQVLLTDIDVSPRLPSLQKLLTLNSKTLTNIYNDIERNGIL